MSRDGLIGVELTRTTALASVTPISSAPISSDGRTLEGYAAVFNFPARINDAMGPFDEVLLPGAFAQSIRERMPVLQFDHGKDPRVGGIPIGSIQDLREDGTGLYVRARLFDNATVEPVREAIAAGVVNGMSFRFMVPQGGDKWSSRGGVDYREISQADVRELGPVVFPAYEKTSVTVRDGRKRLRDHERLVAAGIIPPDMTPDQKRRHDALVAQGIISGRSGLTPRQQRDHDALRRAGII
jgi:HK97 family phage prohead protease